MKTLIMKKILFLAVLITASVSAFAQINQPKEIKTSQQLGDYTVHFNVLNSKQIPPEVAKIYDLNRGKDIGYINISVTKTENGTTSLGLPAKLQIKTTNLMQQTKVVDAREIKEPEATYYLAAFRINNEEVLHFDVTATVEGSESPLNVQFDRTVYTE